MEPTRSIYLQKGVTYRNQVTHLHSTMKHPLVVTMLNAYFHKIEWSAPNPPTLLLRHIKQVIGVHKVILVVRVNLFNDECICHYCDVRWWHTLGYPNSFLTFMVSTIVSKVVSAVVSTVASTVATHQSRQHQSTYKSMYTHMQRASAHTTLS